MRKNILNFLQEKCYPIAGPIMSLPSLPFDSAFKVDGQYGKICANLVMVYFDGYGAFL